MTDDIRDAARQALGSDGAHTKAEDSPVKNAPETSESAETLETFRPETATPDSLDPANAIGGDAEPGSASDPTSAAGTADVASGDAASDGAARLPAEPDYKDKWLRTEAELQNFRRRAQRDREDAVRSSEDRILIDLIELLDDVERAIAALTPEQAADPWTQGVVLTATRMREALARRGVTVIVTQGQMFDPSFHEALLEVPAPEGILPGAVAQEVLKGYRRGDRALRAARVVVARADG